MHLRVPRRLDQFGRSFGCIKTVVGCTNRAVDAVDIACWRRAHASAELLRHSPAQRKCLHTQSIARVSACSPAAKKPAESGWVQCSYAAFRDRAVASMLILVA